MRQNNTQSKLPKTCLIAWMLWNCPRITNSKYVFQSRRANSNNSSGNIISFHNRMAAPFPTENAILPKIVGGSTETPEFDHSWMIAFGHESDVGSNEATGRAAQTPCRKKRCRRRVHRQTNDHQEEVKTRDPVDHQAQVPSVICGPFHDHFCQ